MRVRCEADVAVAKLMISWGFLVWKMLKRNHTRRVDKYVQKWIQTIKCAVDELENEVFKTPERPCNNSSVKNVLWLLITDDEWFWADEVRKQTNAAAFLRRAQMMQNNSERDAHTEVEKNFLLIHDWIYMWNVKHLCAWVIDTWF